jgi:F-type H+-transporting ATPase subunit delta
MAQHGAARRYAEAVFELATRDGKVDEWRREMGIVCGLAQDKKLVRVVDSPAVGLEERRKAMEQILGKRVSRQILSLSLLLVERGSFSSMPAISDEYDDLVRRSLGIVAVTVTTPAPLSQKELAGLKVKLEELAGARVEIDTRTDPTLIGGIRVTIGDRQIDASVSTRLARLRKQLIQGTSKAAGAA